MKIPAVELEKLKNIELTTQDFFSDEEIETLENFIIATPNIKDFINPEEAFNLFCYMLEEFEEVALKPLAIKGLELIMAEDAEYSYYYAEDVLKGRFELGEPAIAQDYFFSMTYARDVICGDFPLGEKAISQDFASSYHYANALGKRFELGEKKIAESGQTSLAYATKVIKGRFPLGEKEIEKKPKVKEEYDRMLKRCLGLF